MNENRKTKNLEKGFLKVSVLTVLLPIIVELC